MRTGPSSTQTTGLFEGLDPDALRFPSGGMRPWVRSDIAPIEPGVFRQPDGGERRRGPTGREARRYRLRAQWLQQPFPSLTTGAALPLCAWERSGFTRTVQQRRYFWTGERA